MKHKIFLILIVFLFVFSSMALADFTEKPIGTSNPPTAPNGNTGAPVLVGVDTVNIAHKFGTWEGADPNKTTKDYIKSVLTNGSYAGSETINGTKKGGFGEKLVVNGATRFLTSDLLTQVDDQNTTKSFDQYLNIPKFVYPINTSAKNSKPLQGIIAGRILGGIALTDKDDFETKQYTPAYSLDFQATSTAPKFEPTTNIGLGDSCNLYAPDIGVTIGSGGGCPAGSYISYYSAPSFSGTLSGTNNTNNQIMATCTKFNPSANPTNTGRCATNPFSTNTYLVERLCRRVNMTTYTSFTSCNFQDTDMGDTGQCKFNLVIDKTKNSKNPKTHGYHWTFGGGCGTGGCLNGHYPTLNNVDPDTTGNISYVDSCNSTNSFWEWKATDDYGQYMYWKP